MASITVLKGRDKVMQMALKKERFLIGRQETADIVLDNITVSRNHAMILNKDGLWRIEDLSGKNGVFINGQQKTRHVLRDEDKVEIGKFMIVFHQAVDDLEKNLDMQRGQAGSGFKVSFDDLVTEAVDDSMVAGPKVNPGRLDSAASTMHLPPEQLAAIHKEMNARRAPHLEMLSGVQRSNYGLDKEAVSLGRSNSADVRLEGGITVGKVQATISKYGDKYFIEHLSGFSGTKVNGQKINQKVQLQNGDTIEIGNNKLAFVSGIDTANKKI